MFRHTLTRATGASINIVFNGESLNINLALRCVNRVLLNMSGQMACIGQRGELTRLGFSLLYRYLVNFSQLLFH